MSGETSMPWAVRGEAIMFLARSPGPAPALPEDLTVVPGPCSVSAARYLDSPVGPFLAITVAHLARRRARVGWCTTAVIVDRHDARSAAASGWGRPPEVGELRWLARGDERELVWEDHGLTVRGRGRGPGVRLVLAHPDVGRRGDGRHGGSDPTLAHVRAARVRVENQGDHDLAWLAGNHAGAVASDVHRVPRRAPAGRNGARTLRPRATLEPALRTDVPPTPEPLAGSASALG